MNENAREFLVMIPVPYLGAAATALGPRSSLRTATD